MFVSQYSTAGNVFVPSRQHYAQVQEPQQQHYYPAAANGDSNGVGAGSVGYVPAQPFQMQQQQFHQPMGGQPYSNAGGGDSHNVMQQQQQQHSMAVHGDPNSLSGARIPVETSNPNIALSLFDLPAPLAVSSLPPVAPREMDELAQLMAVALQHRCEAMKPFERTHQSTFHSSRVPGISIWDYVRRIAKYSGCSAECFIVALVVIDRFSQATGTPVTLRNIHRLAITAVMVSAKLRDDIYYSNAYYASIGGVTARELFYLELQLLSTINWSTWVELTLFEEYVKYMRDIYEPFLPAAQQQG